MEINYLREFVEIATIGNFSIAADNLCVSQATISKHIKALEIELQTLLFDRTTRSVSLTNSGKLLLQYAREITDLDLSFRREFDEQKAKMKKTLNIASIPVMAQYNITGLIADFRSKNSDIDVKVNECEGDVILDSLGRRECELAFIRGGINNTELELLDYYEDHLVAVLPTGHELAGKKIIDLKQLFNENFLFLDVHTKLYSICREACLEAGFEPKIVYTGKRPENIISLVSAKVGVSLLMHRQVIYINNPSITFVNLTNKQTSCIYLAHLKNRRLSSSAQAFWNFVSDKVNIIL